MERIPKAKDMRPTYENFLARCPWCERENIFNRATDLPGSDRISYLEVKCLFADCAKPFYLNGDLANAAYSMIIWDCYELLERKHYAYCILNLAQSFEVFFALYLRVQLLYRPFGLDSDKDIEQLNKLNTILYQKTKKLPFEPMRNLFFWAVLQARHPVDLDEAATTIKALPDKPTCPSDDEIKGSNVFNDSRIPDLLLRLKACDVAELRNQVVHKRAYRPTLNEVNHALNETREILFPLARRLDAHVDDINWYMRKHSDESDP